MAWGDREFLGGHKQESADLAGTDATGVWGGDLLKQLAAQAGLSSDAAGVQLANLLPSLIDKLTPDAKVKNTKLIEQGLNFCEENSGNTC